MMVQALLPGCRTTQEATNQSEARRSKVPLVMSLLSRQYVAPATAVGTCDIPPHAPKAVTHGLVRSPCMAHAWTRVE